MAEPEVDRYTEAYMLCKAKIAELDKDYEARKKPLLDLKSHLEGWFDTFLKTTGVTSAATPHGTVHYNVRYSATLEDADAFMQFVHPENCWLALRDPKS